MAVISDAAIAAAARDAGIPADQIAIAVAIAIAESGGDQLAHNTTPPDNSYGLWQINMYGNLGPNRRREFGLNSNDELYNVAINARVMAVLSNKGQNWKPWTTYTRGTYFRYIQRGRAAAGGIGGTVTPVTSESKGLSDLGELITDKAVYRKAGLYVLGGLLILIGAVAMFGLQNLIPLGKVGKLAKAVK